MYKTYFLGAAALLALTTGLAATLGPAPDDKADALALGAPASAAEASFRRHPLSNAGTTGTTVPFVEHDDDSSRRLTTTTTTTTTTIATTTTTAPPATTSPPATTAPKAQPTTTTAAAGGAYNSSFEAEFRGQHQRLAFLERARGTESERFPRRRGQGMVEEDGGGRVDIALQPWAFPAPVVHGRGERRVRRIGFRSVWSTSRQSRASGQHAGELHSFRDRGLGRCFRDDLDHPRLRRLTVLRTP